MRKERSEFADAMEALLLLCRVISMNWRFLQVACSLAMLHFVSGIVFPNLPVRADLGGQWWILGIATATLAESTFNAPKTIETVFTRIRNGNRQENVFKSLLEVCCHAEPPFVAESLVGFLAKERYRNGLLQNLDEDFQNDLAAGMSLARAKRRYWAAALNSIGPQLWAFVRRIGLIGVVADYIRGKLG